jgi:hypothetical protein
MEHWVGVDWIVLWKLYQCWFFLLFVVISFPCKVWLYRSVAKEPSRKTGLWSAASSIVGPASNIWLPVIPIMGTLFICAVTGRDSYRQPIYLIVPAVAILMGIQAAALDAAIVRVAFRNRREPGILRNIVAINIGAALLGVGIVFWWISRHPPNMIA